MSDSGEVGTVGEWMFHDHRMARFEGRRVFSWVAAADDEGTRWSWVVMRPGRDPESRTKGEAGTALEAAQAADAAGGDEVRGAPDPQAVERWASDHLKWRIEVDSAETEATRTWSKRSE